LSEAIQSYRDLKTWQKGIELVKLVYGLLLKFPRHELYGLSDQLRRSAVSVPSNIAEGQARQHTGEFRQFLSMALGSAAEVDTQLIIAHELGYITDADLTEAEDRLNELRRMTYSLLSKLPRRAPAPKY
jgi:four helix bundle protein